MIEANRMNTRDNDDEADPRMMLDCQGPAWEGPAREGASRGGVQVYAAGAQQQNDEQAEEIADLQQRLNTLAAHTATMEQKLRAEREARSWAEQQMKVLLNAAQSLNERSERAGLPALLPPWKDWREVDAEALLGAWARS
jgi:hypothetical protein